MRFLHDYAGLLLLIGLLTALTASNRTQIRAYWTEWFRDMNRISR